MKYRYYTCDVFTETRFGGNPLAVLPHADGLTDRQMQQIAREFNLSETAFVFPPKAGQTRKVRIFTPAREVPFAGHPNVGTAFILAHTGELGQIREALSVTFEEEAGLVAVSITESNGSIVSCEVKAPQPLTIDEIIPARLVASALSLDVEEILTTRHQPRVVSVGLSFVIAELTGRSTLERPRVDSTGFGALPGEGAGIYVYVRTTGDVVDVRARMFAPLSGVPEDPATGSATCAVAGLLTHLNEKSSGEFSYRIAQGVEMGRPSILMARAEKSDGIVQGTWVGGACVLTSEGFIYVD